MSLASSPNSVTSGRKSSDDLLAFRKAQRLAGKRDRRRSTDQSTIDSELAAGSKAGNSFSAAFARSFLLILGIYFKRPGRLFRPTRVDTLTSLRQLALSSHQALSPSFIRALVKEKGTKTLLLSIFPPLAINTSLGFLLFTSHTYFSWLLAKVPLFRPRLNEGDIPKGFWEDFRGILADQGMLLEDEDDAERRRGDGLSTRTKQEESATARDQRIASQEVDMALPFSFDAEEQLALMNSFHRLPHPTLLSAVAGMMAGALQGIGFTPIENAVKLIQRGTLSWLDAFRTIFSIHRPSALRSHLSSSISHSPNSRFPRSMSELRSFLGLGSGRGGFWTAWKGVRWGMRRDMVSYGLFFGCFDVSRRVGLRVKRRMAGAENGEIVMALERKGRESDIEPEQAPTSARLAQAGCLIAGGVGASLLAEFASRPFRHLEDLIKVQERKAPGLSFKPQLNSTSGIVKPFSTNEGNFSIFKKAVRKDGLASFFVDPAKMYAVQAGGKPVKSNSDIRRTMSGRLQARASALGWKLVGVGPWGLGFLVFAYLGGEV